LVLKHSAGSYVRANTVQAQLTTDIMDTDPSVFNIFSPSQIAEMQQQY
jgi:hypothetical protein